MTGTTTNNNPRYVLFDDVVSLTGCHPARYVVAFEKARSNHTNQVGLAPAGCLTQ